MVTKLKYSEEGFTIVADDTADLLKVFDHVMEGPQVVEVRNVMNVEGPSPWADERIRELVKQGAREALEMNMPDTFADDAPVSVGPLIGEELLAKSGIGVKVDEDGKFRVVVEAKQFVVPPIGEELVGAVAFEENGKLTFTTSDGATFKSKPEPEWIEWNPPRREGCGGPAGIVDGTTLKVRLRDGTEMGIEMGTLDAYWNNDDCKLDIVAYRVIA